MPTLLKEEEEQKVEFLEFENDISGNAEVQIPRILFFAIFNVF